MDSFETGIWTFPVIFANVIIFGLLILFSKKKLPDFLEKNFIKLFNFEISKKISLICLLIILIIYVGFSAGELAQVEKWEDYQGVKKRLDRWEIDQISGNYEPHVKYFLHWASMQIFGNYGVIPFIASISLIITTYFFTQHLTKKNFPGLISAIILLQSNVFLTYDTTVSYSNFWILFYLLSLFAVLKFWPLSPISYLLSIPSKALTVLFLPLSLFFIFRSEVSKKVKILAAITNSLIIIILIAFAVSSGGVDQQEDFNGQEFLSGFTSFAFQLRFDGLVLLFLIPLIFGLFIMSRIGFKQAESIMILIAGVLLTAPILTGFTDQTNQPYRFVPLVVFFSIGVGMLLTKRKS